ncbi:bifunctional aminoglycoside phosphotransferase/ATP-binding protein [Kaarinaea lacus]
MHLINNMRDRALYDHPVDAFEVIETHISWVLLTGQYVYKIKKPVNFGFLDFSTLEKRHLYCEEEVRLNRRLAPQLYIGVVAIHGTQEHPNINGQGPVLEYAVKMKQFPQSTQLDRLLAEKGLDNAVIDKLAGKVARFHLAIDSVEKDSSFGDLEHIQQPVLDNFSHIRSCIDDKNVIPLLNKLEEWTKKKLKLLTEIIQKRKDQGFVRECHGDMHLRNIALWNDEIIIFDCIEFNKNFYWIDVVSEIAFLVMDLEDRKHHALARRFLNSYLEITGDYEGLRLLRFYKVYRAMVRAKVDALRVGQEQAGTDEYTQTFNDMLQYLHLAEIYICPSEPCLLINHGLSGSGKSVGTRKLLDSFPAIQVRSDVERKRLFNVAANVKLEPGFEQSIYTKEATQKTYARLLEIAQCLLSAGYSVVIDAANLKAGQRQPFIEMASLMRIPYFILNYTAPDETLIERVRQRAESGDDVSDATLEILQHQFDNHEPLTPDERLFTIDIDTSKDMDVEGIIDLIHLGK